MYRKLFVVPFVFTLLVLIVIQSNAATLNIAREEHNVLWFTSNLYPYGQNIIVGVGNTSEHTVGEGSFYTESRLWGIAVNGNLHPWSQSVLLTSIEWFRDGVSDIIIYNFSDDDAIWNPNNVVNYGIDLTQNLWFDTNTLLREQGQVLVTLGIGGEIINSPKNFTIQWTP